jgi:hypothetical protein
LNVIIPVLNNNVEWEPFRVWILEELVPFLDKVGIRLDSVPSNGICILLSREEKELFRSAITMYSDTSVKGFKPIVYGTRVILEHKDSGTITVPMRLKLLSDTEEGKKKSKASKSDKLFCAARERSKASVSQLQKVGFQLENSTFFSFVNNELDAVYSQNHNDGQAVDILHEHSVWGLVGIGIFLPY